MVAMAFNAQQYTPSYGGGGNNLPPGKYKGVIVASSAENAKSGQGGFLMFTLTPIEGPLTGQKHDDRLNLHHTNPKTVEIANQQLSAYCHVLGKYQFGDTAELHNIPFCFEIGWQKNNEPTQENPNGGYTEVKAIFDVNGNAPGKAGAGPQAQPNQPAQPAQPPANPPAGVQAGAQGGWGGQPQQQQPAQGGGWGGQPAQVQPAQGQPAAGGWGGQPQQQQAPAQGQAGPWGGGQPAAGGNPPQWGNPPAQ